MGEMWCDLVEEIYPERSSNSTSSLDSSGSVPARGVLIPWIRMSAFSNDSCVPVSKFRMIHNCYAGGCSFSVQNPGSGVEKPIAHILSVRNARFSQY